MIKIPRSEFNFTFSRSSGAGGQNVNKVNSKVTMEWDYLISTAISDEIKRRFESSFARFINSNKVVIISQKHRSQNLNIEDCISKLHFYLSQVEHPPKSRKATKPTKSSVLKRLSAKTIKSKVKKMRQEKF